MCHTVTQIIIENKNFVILPKINLHILDFLNILFIIILFKIMLIN